MTNLEWLKTLSAEELADWFYDEWLHHLQYRWSSSRGGLIVWLKDRKDAPQTEKYCDKCNHKGCDNCIADGSNPYCVPSQYKPQTEPLQTCSVNGRPYSECSSCEHFRCMADEPQMKCYLRTSCDHYGDKRVCGRCREYNLYSHTKTEPQTERSE